MQQCVWVRVPSGAPRRSKLHIACSDFFIKSQSALIPLLLLSNRDSLRWICGWFWGRPESLYLESVHAFQLVASVISLATSFLCFASKTHRALILLLLASEPDSLRWIPVRVGANRTLLPQKCSHYPSRRGRNPLHQNSRFL